MDIQEFEKSKIYERLKYEPQPPGYAGKIPWTVQQQIAATNGIHYLSMIGKLSEYPIPDIPLPPATRPDQLLLDIGNGWGRWLVASGEKNYIPIGIDFRLEFCETALSILKDRGIQGYTAVADLKQLPFKDEIFDIVWSFSVIQHTHLSRLESCTSDIARILRKDGYCKLEFPNKNGLRNRIGPVKEVEKDRDDYNSWSVRYYTIAEYKKIFLQYFDNFSYENHSFLGIGILDNDLDYVKDKKTRMQIQASLFMSKLTKIIRPLTRYSDSIYIKAIKTKGSLNKDIIDKFWAGHENNVNNNLNIVPLLACPITKGPLVLSDDKRYLISPSASRKFPIVNNIPILVASQAETL